MKFALLPEETILENIDPPEATLSSTVWILVSDSSMALVITLKKYDLADHFAERKPPFC